MDTIILLGTIAGIFVFALYSLGYYNKYKAGVENNEYWFDLIPSIFPIIGILSTVGGITYGLFNFVSTDIEGSIPKLLGGLKTAFIGTLLGLILLWIFSRWNAVIKYQLEKGKKSDEVLAIEELIKEIKLLKNDMSHKDDNGNIITMGNAIRDIYSQSKRQADALDTFAEDLAEKIGITFDEVLNNENKAMLMEMKNIKDAIDSLSEKLKSPAEDMTKNIVDKLEKSIAGLVSELKNTLKGETKSEIEILLKNLNNVSKSLETFPDTMKDIQATMVENFKEILSGLKDETISTTEQLGEQTGQQVAQITAQTQEFNGKITNILDTINKALSESIGQQQKDQKEIVAEQTKNMEAFSAILLELNQSIESMSNVANTIRANVETLNVSYNNLQGTTNSFQNITERIDSTTNLLGSHQNNFIAYSNEFLANNKENIAEIQKSLGIAKAVSEDYADKFGIIESGLQGIFGQLGAGLEDYQKTVKDSLEEYLNKYSTNLNGVVEALSSAVEAQNDLLDDLNEIVSKIKK